MQRAEAQQRANELMMALSPLCRRVAVAGSIRRLKDEVKDIEIVCSPRVLPDLLGEEMPIPEFGAEIAKLGKLLKRGPRYKQLDLGDINADIFIVGVPAQWGVIMTIRTGSAEFNKWAVTAKRYGGGMPNDSVMMHGCVYRKGEMIEMPEEEDFLHYIGVGWVEPAKRTADLVKALEAKQRSRNGNPD